MGTRMKGDLSVLSAYQSKSAGEPFVERRKRSRIPLFYHVNLRVGQTQFGKCLLKDISSRGARICVDKFAWVPKRFLIECPKGEFLLHAEKVWNKNDEIGVQFIKAPEFGPVVDATE